MKDDVGPMANPLIASAAWRTTEANPTYRISDQVLLEPFHIDTYRGNPGGPVFDEQYLCALQNRDSAAEQHLVGYFSKSIQIKLRRKLNSRELVEDAHQETFLRVFSYFRSGKSLANPTSLPAFVHAVCHNVALELVRRSSQYYPQAENMPELVDPGDDPEEQMVTAERKLMVREIIEKLSAKDRKLLQRVLEQEDKDTLCREFHVDRNYLRVLLYRARIRFKTTLALTRLKGHKNSSIAPCA
jgi:RNA polymerase sigma factor (sigma-70 family)